MKNNLEILLHLSVFPLSIIIPISIIITSIYNLIFDYI